MPFRSSTRLMRKEEKGSIHVSEDQIPSKGGSTALKQVAEEVPTSVDTALRTNLQKQRLVMGKNHSSISSKPSNSSNAQPEGLSADESNIEAKLSRSLDPTFQVSEAETRCEELEDSSRSERDLLEKDESIGESKYDTDESEWEA